MAWRWRKKGLSIGRDRLFHLLREHDLLVPRRRRRRRTTQAGARRVPNLLRDVRCPAPLRCRAPDQKTRRVA